MLAAAHDHTTGVPGVATRTKPASSLSRDKAPLGTADRALVAIASSVCTERQQPQPTRAQSPFARMDWGEQSVWSARRATRQIRDVRLAGQTGELNSHILGSNRQLSFLYLPWLLLAVRTLSCKDSGHARLLLVYYTRNVVCIVENHVAFAGDSYVVHTT